MHVRISRIAAPSHEKMKGKRRKQRKKEKKGAKKKGRREKRRKKREPTEMIHIFRFSFFFLMPFFLLQDADLCHTVRPVWRETHAVWHHLGFEERVFFNAVADFAAEAVRRYQCMKTARGL